MTGHHRMHSGVICAGIVFVISLLTVHLPDVGATAVPVFPGDLGDGRNPLGGFGASNNYRPSFEDRKRCPLCDSSVYSYCSEKLLHDACCCNDPYTTNLPYQCRYADCSFIHANTCKEHRLITACCCTNLYFNVRSQNLN